MGKGHLTEGWPQNQWKLKVPCVKLTQSLMLRGVTEERGLCAVYPPSPPALPLSSQWPVGKRLSFARLPVLYLQTVWVVTVAASHGHCEDRTKRCARLSVHSTGSLFIHTWLPAAAGAAVSTREGGIWGQGDVAGLCSPTTWTGHGSGPDTELGVLRAEGGSGSTSLRVLTF